MERNAWKLIAGGAALFGVTAGGIAGATSSDFDLNDRRSAIALAETAPADPGDPVVVAADDGSPESADSPNESLQDSADSPFDSPDDAGWVDASPESADSPNESIDDSPPPAPAAPAGGGDDDDTDDASWDSPDSDDTD